MLGRFADQKRSNICAGRKRSGLQSDFDLSVDCTHRPFLTNQTTTMVAGPFPAQHKLSAPITSPKFGHTAPVPTTHATASAPARPSADDLAAVTLSLVENNTFDRSLYANVVSLLEVGGEAL